MNGFAVLSNIWLSIQARLFPLLEDELGVLDDLHRQFVAVCEICNPRQHLADYRWIGNGCPPKDRLALCLAFIAKAVWDFPTTRMLIDAIRYRPTLRRLCGWETLAEVPSEATFSRAFAVFATDGLPQIIHMAMVKQHLADKLVGHISRDATAIHAREKAAKKDAQPVPQPDETQEPLTPEPTRLQRQLERGLDENLADLPRACDWGTKKDSKGKKLCWRGYKLHIDVIDGDLPISWLLTSASLHDSQAAIPLAQINSGDTITFLLPGLRTAFPGQQWATDQRLKPMQKRCRSQRPTGPRLPTKRCQLLGRCRLIQKRPPVAGQRQQRRRLGQNIVLAVQVQMNAAPSPVLARLTNPARTGLSSTRPRNETLLKDIHMDKQDIQDDVMRFLSCPSC